MSVFVWRRRGDLTCAAAQAASRLWSATGTSFTTARVQILSFKKKSTPDGCAFLFGAEGGIWTPARLITAYSLSRGAPSASWVLLQAESMDIQLIARILYHGKYGVSRKTSRLFPSFEKKFKIWLGFLLHRWILRDIIHFTFHTEKYPRGWRGRSWKPRGG